VAEDTAVVQNAPTLDEPLHHRDIASDAPEDFEEMVEEPIAAVESFDPSSTTDILEDDFDKWNDDAPQFKSLEESVPEPPVASGKAEEYSIPTDVDAPEIVEAPIEIDEALVKEEIEDVAGHEIALHDSSRSTGDEDSTLVQADAPFMDHSDKVNVERVYEREPLEDDEILASEQLMEGDTMLDLSEGIRYPVN
jgi:hypothetical protein